jgi:hypothetical protein
LITNQLKLTNVKSWCSGVDNTSRDSAHRDEQLLVAPLQASHMSYEWPESHWVLKYFGGEISSFRRPLRRKEMQQRRVPKAHASGVLAKNPPAYETRDKLRGR